MVNLSICEIIHTLCNFTVYLTVANQTMTTGFLLVPPYNLLSAKKNNLLNQWNK